MVRSLPLLVVVLLGVICCLPHGSDAKEAELDFAGSSVEIDDLDDSLSSVEEDEGPQQTEQHLEQAHTVPRTHREAYPRGSIRDEFTRSFHDRCDKYSFVRDFHDRIERPTQRYVLFTYHDRGLNNGGFGDRLGGLVTAFVHAMRFNRTLIVKASNGFNDLFKPHHPLDEYTHTHTHTHDTEEEEKEEERFTWGHAPQWSQFSQWKRSLPQQPFEKHRALYELDLSDCVSNTEQGFTEEQTSRCAMDEGDSDKPVIRFASNRAYLCRYANLSTHHTHHTHLTDHTDHTGHTHHTHHTGHTHHTDLTHHTHHTHHTHLTDLTGHTHVAESVFSALNISRTDSDLFEVAGCVLRLVLWPRERLWHEVDRAYEDLLASLLTEKESKLHTLEQALLQTKQNKANKNKNKKSVQEKKKKEQHKAISAEVAVLRREIPLLLHSHSHSSSSSPSPSSAVAGFPFTTNPHPPILLGMHFRCGDRHSFSKFLLNTDGHHPHACVANSPEDIGDTGHGEHQKSIYLRAGNPAGIGECGKHLLKYYKINRNKAQPVVDPNGFFTFPPNHVKRNSSSLVFITSDNVYAEEQMKQYVQHPLSIISPQGCHIELDPSKACYVFTTRYWFMLSLSDVIISQSYGDFNAPTSAFSRYAGIYGLKPESPFRSGKYCGDQVFPWSTLSRQNQANWFC